MVDFVPHGKYARCKDSQEKKGLRKGYKHEHNEWYTYSRLVGVHNYQWTNHTTPERLGMNHTRRLQLAAVALSVT